MKISTTLEVRAQQLAVEQNIYVEPKADGTYITLGPSERYMVAQVGHDLHCICPIAQLGFPCKHVGAVQLHLYEVQQREEVRARSLELLEVA